MNKTRNSVLNSLSSLMFTAVNGICNLIVTRKLITVYGSDFNGLNSTASQFINILLVIEGGFAIAANVALFAPLKDNNHDRVVHIFSAVSKRFNIIGIVFTIVGLLGSAIVSLIIKTSISYEICFLVFLMLIISTGFGLFYSTKFKVLFQSDQREYIINFVSIVTYLVSYILMFIAISLKWHMLIVRVIVMAFAIVNSLVLGIICKKMYPFINQQSEPDYQSIKGTKDVFVAKIVGVFYYAAPILFISSIINTTVASIYAVYNMVFVLLRSAENSIINAPRMSLGRLISEKGLESDDFKNVYNEYECCTFVSISVLISVATVLIMPFVKVYTNNISDADYINWFMAIILSLICFIECIHIPAGNLINMAGKFKQGKYIQLISGVVLLVSLLIGGFIFGINGILVSILLTAIVLAVFEIGYVRFFLIKKNFIPFLKNFGSSVVPCVLLITFELLIKNNSTELWELFIWGIVFLAANGIVVCLINFIFNRKCFMSVFRRFANLLRSNK